MSITISECTPSDFPRAFEVFSLAFGATQPFINAMWPAHETPQGRADGAQRMREAAASDRHTTFLKATTAEGAIVGLARWNVWADGNVALHSMVEGPWWDDGPVDKDYASALATSYFARREQAVVDSAGHLVSLGILVVHPDHQGRGVGKSLMQWGADKADSLDVEAVVEGFPAGVPLYEAFGFRMKEVVTVEPPEKWADERKQMYHWMVRPRKGEQAG